MDEFHHRKRNPDMGIEPVPFLYAHPSQHFSAPIRYIVKFFEIHQQVDHLTLERTIQEIYNRHDLLRLKTGGDTEHKKFFIAGSEPIVWKDLTKFSEIEQQIIIHNTAKNIYATLDSYDGILSRFIYFERGNHKPGLFLIILHHIVADMHSTHILLHDIQTIYKQIQNGEPLHLAQRTASFNQFAERLKRYLHRDFPQELKYWLSLKAKTAYHPVDYPENRYSDAESGETKVRISKPRKVPIVLDEGETRRISRLALLTKVQVEDILLATFVHVLTAFIGEAGLHIYAANNGRTLFEDIDLSHTIGYITMGSWLYLEPSTQVPPKEILTSIIEQRKQIPHKGIGISLAVNYAGYEDEIWTQFRTNDAMKTLKQIYFSDNLMFNYLGKEAAIPLLQQSIFRPVGQEYRKLIMHPATTSSEQETQQVCRLKLTSAIRAQKLYLDWEYDEALYRPDTVITIAQRYLKFIKDVLYLV